MATPLSYRLVKVVVTSTPHYTTPPTDHTNPSLVSSGQMGGHVGRRCTEVPL
eukprot:m.437963 g.437963  ORF g.437963 m.437963 type:complete len:52 (+) comp112683_c0_seq1:215-370(+)